MSGLFISFEGIDGAGKSTHLDKLSQLLQRQYKVNLTREPGGTALAEKLRSILLHDKMDKITETLLIFAARREHIVNLIEPALQRGEVVLCDRFTDATFAYQGGGRKVAKELLISLQTWVQNNAQQQILQPDLTFWFDTPVAVANQRLLDNGTNLDRFEQEQKQFFEQVRQGYLELQQQYPHRIIRIDASNSKQQVFAQIVNCLKQKNILVDTDGG